MRAWRAAVTSWTVESDVDVETDGTGHWAVTVRRHPADASGTRTEDADGFPHLACDEEEQDHHLTESASVILRRRHASTTVSALS